jgi:hypothetical protein
VDRPALGDDSNGGEAVRAVSKAPRQSIKCRRWFYDSIFHPEGKYGCRWHDCDRINHVTRIDDLRSRPRTLREALSASFWGRK